MSLIAALVTQIKDEQLPFRGAKALRVLSAEDQATFATEISALAQLSTNQLQQVCEWLHDLMKIKKASLGELLESSELSEWVSSKNLDRRQKADALVKVLRRLRNPGLSEKESEIEGIKRALQAGSA